MTLLLTGPVAYIMPRRLKPTDSVMLTVSPVLLISLYLFHFFADLDKVLN